MTLCLVTLNQARSQPQNLIFKKILRVITVCQKLGVILESKVVQKLSLEKNFLTNNGLLD